MIIYKYRIELIDTATVVVPVGAKFLKVAEQEGELWVWCLVPSDSTETMKVLLYIRGTGYEFTEGEGEYIDSVLMLDGSVWHIFS